MVYEPVAKGGGFLGAEFLDDGVDFFKRVEEVELQSFECALKTAEPVKGLHTEVLGENNLPAKTAYGNFGSGEKFLQYFRILSEKSHPLDLSSLFLQFYILSRRINIYRSTAFFLL